MNTDSGAIQEQIQWVHRAPCVVPGNIFIAFCSCFFRKTLWGRYGFYCSAPEPVSVVPRTAWETLWMWLRNLRWGMLLGSLGGPSAIREDPRRKRQEGQGNLQMLYSIARFEDEEGSQEPRDAGDLRKLEKTRRRLQKGGSSTHTLILTWWISVESDPGLSVRLLKEDTFWKINLANGASHRGVSQAIVPARFSYHLLAVTW